MRLLLLLTILLVAATAKAQVTCKNSDCNIALNKDLGIQLYLALSCPDSDQALKVLRKEIRGALKLAPKARTHQHAAKSAGINNANSPDINYIVTITLKKDDLAYWLEQLSSSGPIKEGQQKKLEKELGLALSLYGPPPSCKGIRRYTGMTPGRSDLPGHTRTLSSIDNKWLSVPSPLHQLRRQRLINLRTTVSIASAGGSS
jgi:hypothetical protein